MASFNQLDFPWVRTTTEPTFGVFGTGTIPFSPSDTPELHHYTSYAGLKGIVESNVLRATHYSSLNDTTEFTLLKQPMLEAVTSRFFEYFRVQRHTHLFLRKSIERIGIHKTASNAALSFVEALYDGRLGFPLGASFVASFCSHAGDRLYEQQHGLLSQWRGYATGGYCIVFDTSALVAMLKQEFGKHYWAALNIAPVQYAVDGISVDQIFPKLLGGCDAFLKGVLFTEAFAEFHTAASLFKHQGFREEREIRIVATPASQAILDREQAKDPKFFPAPLKRIHEYDVGKRGRQYITLFERLEGRLPIKRVIVGPARNQHENYQRALTLEMDAALTRSETPFIG